MPAVTEKTIRLCLSDQSVLTCLWVRGGVRNINLRMQPDGTLRVSSPKHVTEARLKALLQEKMDFIMNARARASQTAEAAVHAAENLTEGGILYILGVPYTIRTAELPRRTRWDEPNRVLYLAGDTPADRRTQLMQLLQQEAPARLTPMFRAWNRRFRVIPGFPTQEIPLRFRWMKSRWGSCRVGTAADYAITLNSRLLLYPSACAEYVMVHELAHILQPDHSPAFYAVVAAMMPDWAERKQRLRQNSQV